ncbi:MAG: glucose-6-phosphate dehydrogenase assembly protein OpcA [Chloroflexi bacterium]|nr:glucose-6-phosphate dehydrogenase assembly protein OpcA [Chloroflexota bacterium]
MHATDEALGLDAPTVGDPLLRFSSRTTSLAGIEAELAKVWAATSLTTTGDTGEAERRVSARTSVLNLVVIARQPEIGARAAAVIRMLAGRHPSRTLIVSSADPDGPSWLDAHIQAICMLPRPDAAETCAEFIDLVAGGEAGRHVAAIVAPLLVHDLPVTLWWPGDPPLGTRQAVDMLAMADRLVVDGSHWSGDGLDRLQVLARLVGEHGAGIGELAVSDFAMIRQSRWREAIASSFDRPELRPFLSGITAITVRYAAHRGAGPWGTNLIKPLYHVGWLASRLGLVVAAPLRPVVPDGASESGDDLGLRMTGRLRASRRSVAVAVLPMASPMPPGTTLTVELSAERRGASLEVVVSAEADAVMVHATVDGRSMPVRRFMAPRRTEVELLAETIESVGRDPVAVAALLAAAELVRPT